MHGREEPRAAAVRTKGLIPYLKALGQCCVGSFVCWELADRFHFGVNPWRGKAFQSGVGSLLVRVIDRG